MGKDNFEVLAMCYVSSGEATLLQGVKGNRTPRGAVAGSNGSFVMPGSRPEINLMCSDGETRDIYSCVKGCTERSRVTETYAKQISAGLENQTFTSDSDLAEAVKARIEELG